MATLFALKNRTVTGVERAEIDLYGNGERVAEAWRITCSDGTVHTYMLDGGDCPFYAVLNDADLDSIGGLDLGEDGKFLIPWNRTEI